MSYDFTDISGHRIYAAAGVAMASIYSFWIRLRVKSDTGATGNRFIATLVDDAISGGLYNMSILFRAGGPTNELSFGFTKSGGTVNPEVDWLTGWTTPLEVALGFRYDGTDLRIYEGTDATPKATLAETGTPDQSGARFSIGNYYSATSPPTLGNGAWTIHEAAWWPGTALTGANFAALGAGNASGIPLPTDYWPFVSDANALYGGHNGTVTGATVVAHTGMNLYPLATPALVFRPLQA